MSTVGLALLVTLKGADKELPTHASIPSAFDYILFFHFVSLFPSYTKMD